MTLSGCVRRRRWPPMLTVSPEDLATGSGALLGLLRRRALLGRRLLGGRLLGLALLDAALQGLHEVDDLGALALLVLGLAERGGGVEGVALLELGLDEGLQLLLVVVAELA